MAKRFTDTDKWEHAWFMDAPDSLRLAYLYILDKCDTVGVWNPNERLLKFFVGDVTLKDLAEHLGDRLYVMPNGKWWLHKFIDFQYGFLSEDSNSKPIISYIKTLKKHSLWKVYTKGIGTLKDKDKEKDKEKDKDKDKDMGKVQVFESVYMTQQEYEKLIMDWGEQVVEQRVKDMDAYFHQIGIAVAKKKYKSHYHTFLNWIRREQKTSPKTKTADNYNKAKELLGI
jgi:hypothetical protein